MRKLIYTCIILVYAFISGFSQNADIDLLRSINKTRNQNSDVFFKGLSNSVAPVTIICPLVQAGLSFYFEDETLLSNSVFNVAAVGVTTAVIFTIKYSVNRTRPYVTYPDINNYKVMPDPSYPSGHTGLAFSTATYLSLTYPKWYIVAPSFVYASAVGYSRMYLGVHYPSDVLSGAILGSLSSYLSYKINKWYTKKYLVN